MALAHHRCLRRELKIPLRTKHTPAAATSLTTCRSNIGSFVHSLPRPCADLHGRGLSDTAALRRLYQRRWRSGLIVGLLWANPDTAALPPSDRKQPRDKHYGDDVHAHRCLSDRVPSRATHGAPARASHNSGSAAVLDQHSSEELRLYSAARPRRHRQPADRRAWARAIAAPIQSHRGHDRVDALPRALHGICNPAEPALATARVASCGRADGGGEPPHLLGHYAATESAGNHGGGADQLHTGARYFRNSGAPRRAH